MDAPNTNETESIVEESEEGVVSEDTGGNEEEAAEAVETEEEAAEAVETEEEPNTFFVCSKDMHMRQKDFMSAMWGDSENKPHLPQMYDSTASEECSIRSCKIALAP